MSSDPTRLQTLFARAADLQSDERNAFLADECKDDPELLAQLSALLAADVQLNSATARKAFPSLVGLMTDAAQASSLQGLRLGPYELRDELGRGGMGTVYRAERVDGTVAQQVAIKLVRRELLDPDAVERFRRERQILASLDHPNIARLIDAAEAPDGTPYYVMELVVGQPIDAFCDARALDVRQRVGLMRKVCDAVAHAHRNLVVHRDLKPGNILVTTHGEPKLLDFGIARPLVDDHFATGTAQRFFSPYYAAPEQVLGKSIGVGVDVYALGVLIYELVSGNRPFEFAGLTAGQIERLICEVPPPPPSHARAAGEASIRSRIDTELDDIVLRCLRKAPGERYASVEQFDADLANYLERRPVQARPGHALYRTRKFVGRHRLAFGISFAALVALSAAVIAILQQNKALELQRDRVVVERDNAQRLAEFLRDAFLSADPSRTAGADVTARQILEAAHTRLKALSASSATPFPSEFARTIAEVELSLGLAAEAIETTQLALARDHSGLTSARLRTLAARAQLGAGNFEAAEKSLQEAARGLDADDPELRLFGGMLAAQRGDRPRALAAIRGVVDALAGRAPPDKLATLARWKLGDTLVLMDRFDEGLAAVEDTMRWQEATLAPDHPDILLSRMRQVHALRALKHHDKALEVAWAIYDDVRRVYGADGHMAISAENTLAQSLWFAGHKKDSAPRFEAALDLARRELGDTHPGTLRIMFNVASVYFADPKHAAKAEPLYKEVIASGDARLGPAHGLTQHFRASYGRILLDAGRNTEAITLLVEPVGTMGSWSFSNAYRKALADAYSSGVCKAPVDATVRDACSSAGRVVESAAAPPESRP